MLRHDLIDVALSDHFCVFFDLSVTPKPAVGSAVVRGRPMNDSTGTQSMEMIKFENTLCSNVDSIQFNSIQFIYIAPNYNNCHLKAL